MRLDDGMADRPSHRRSHYSLTLIAEQLSSVFRTYTSMELTLNQGGYLLQIVSLREDIP